MAQISYTIPAAGSTPNAAADPEISTALQTLLTLVNGNIDPSNLSTASMHSFLQLANAGTVALAYGTANFTGNGTQFVTFQVSHGLGRGPGLYGGWAQTQTGQFVVVLDPANTDATHISLVANALPGGSFTNGSTFTVTWFAVG